VDESVLIPTGEGERVALGRVSRYDMIPRGIAPAFPCGRDERQFSVHDLTTSIDDHGMAAAPRATRSTALARMTRKGRGHLAIRKGYS